MKHSKHLKVALPAIEVEFVKPTPTVLSALDEFVERVRKASSGEIRFVSRIQERIIADPLQPKHTRRQAKAIRDFLEEARKEVGP